jgi:4-azaleucine resistance transporter AzlC
MTSTQRIKHDFFHGLKDAVPLLLAVAPYGMVLGAQSSNANVSLFEITLMTALNFAGGSEFAAIQLWHSPLPSLTIILITLLINSRHIIMGAAITPYIQHLPKRKMIPALFFMSDEGWAISYRQALKNATEINSKYELSLGYFLGACFPFYPIWVGSAMLGSLLGPKLGNMEQLGFAIAFPAVFLVLLRGMWKGFRSFYPWMISLLIACVTNVFIPGPYYVLAGTFGGLAYVWFKGYKHD